jgi:hypothetical protein
VKNALLGRHRSEGKKRAKICRAYTIRQYQQWERFAVKRRTFKDVATHYHNELESKSQSAHDVETRNLNELWYGTEEKIKNVAATTVGYTQKQEKKICLTRSVPRLIKKALLKTNAADPNSKQNDSCKAHCNDCIQASMKKGKAHV